MKDLFIQELNKVLMKEQIKQNERMENHTSLHIGGEAKYLVTPNTTEEIKAIISLCRQYSMPYYIIGNGSNLLVSDSGYQGLIVKLDENYSDFSINNGIVRAQAGILLSKLADKIAEQSFTGFEFASGIPGTLGGAVTMNAGAYDGEMKQCLIGAVVIDRDGKLHDLSLEDLEFGYRSSILQKKDYVLLEALMKFEKGDKEKIVNRMHELDVLRKEKQPLEQYSAGSTFKRPKGYYAGKLISDAGLRGYRVGGAAVSEKHCGFVINIDHATAKDFMTVIEDVVRIVDEKFGVRLEPEVKYLGEF